MDSACRFNPRAPAGRDFFLHHSQDPIAPVSIHAPLRGATRMHRHKVALPTEFQSTRPCGARLLSALSCMRLLWVSIHAPLRGATLGDARKELYDYVSIHAPLRGATWDARLGAETNWFQSTRPCGARPPMRRRRSSPLHSFNPRAPAGRDLVVVKLLLLLVGFNPRAPAGRDQSLAVATEANSCFNPRAPAGRD